jgi:septum formation topological specificity factor MinE
MADVESIQKELEEVKKRLATVIAKDRAPVEPKTIGGFRTLILNKRW